MIYAHRVARKHCGKVEGKTIGLLVRMNYKIITKGRV